MESLESKLIRSCIHQIPWVCQKEQ